MGRARRGEEDDLTAMLGADRLTKDTFEALSAILAAGDSAFEPLRSSYAIDRLLALAHSELASEPRKAASLARLALYVAQTLTQPEVDVDESLRLEADAQKEYASALVECGEYDDAMRAISAAENFYDLLPVTFTRSKALLSLLKGRALHCMGRSEEGLILVEQSGNLLLGFCDDRKSYVKAKTIYGYILYELERHREALDAYEQAAEIAEADQDVEAQAYIVNNVGLCANQLGQHAKAQECFETALKAFQRLGYKQELSRVRAGMVLVMIARGKYNEAVMESYVNRSEFLALGMPIMAAIVSLRIVEAMILGGRGEAVPKLCNEIIETLTAANLPGEARKAFAYLMEVAHTRSVTYDDLSFVRSFIESAEGNTALEFHVPDEN